MTFVDKVYLKIKVTQRLFSRNSPCISEVDELSVIATCPLALPTGNTTRCVIHDFKIGVRQADKGLSQILETVADMVMTRTVILLTHLIARLLKNTVYRSPEGFSEYVLDTVSNCVWACSWLSVPYQAVKLMEDCDTRNVRRELGVLNKPFLFGKY
jgi:hypothetical protein